MTTLPLVDLGAQYRRLQARIERRLQTVLAHGQFVLGPEVAELEAALTRRAGCAEVVAVASGTDALLLSLMALGIGAGDAVFVPTFSFTATAEAVLLAGATPVFVDVTAESFNIDPADLDRRVETITREGRLKPRAVIAVDLFGRPADYPTIDALAAAHDLVVIADAAQSFGAALGERPVGSLAPLTAISFYPSKPLGAYGDAGAIAVREPALAAVLRSLRVHGENGRRDDHVRIGLNGRLDTLQAAILLAKLEVFDDELTRRRQAAAWYRDRLGAVVKTPDMPAATRSAWAQYTIRVEGRDALRQALAAAGIASGLYYARPIHLQSAYRAYGGGEGSLPVAERLCREALSLPMHADLDEATVERISAAVLAALARPASADLEFVRRHGT